MPPFVVDLERHTICDLIMYWADTQPKVPALIDSAGVTVSYRDLVKEMAVLRHLISESGFSRKDRIGIIHPGGVELAIRMLGVMSGFTAVPLNPAFTETEFRSHLQERGVTALMVDPGTADGAVAAAQSLGIPVLESIEVGNGESIKLEAMTEARLDNDSCPRSLPNDIAVLWGTSGTTARSKIVPSRHRRFAHRAAMEEAIYGIGPDDVGIVFRPLHYSAGFTTLVTSLCCGCAVVVLPKFEPAEFFRCLAANAVTWYSGGPIFHRSIHAYVSENPHVAEGLHLRFMKASSAALEPEIADDLERMLSAPLETNYSSCESGRIANSCHDIAPRKKGTVGVPIEHLGVANTEVRIRSLDGHFMPAGEGGEIVVRGDHVFDGYDNAPELNAEVFVDGWFRTGDVGFIDEEGYLTLTGRIKEMINRGGEKVSPAEVDALLITHPAVKEAATFPVAHPTLGEEVAAVVVLETNSVLSAKDLQAYLVEQISGFKIPKRIVFADDIPKSVAGKVQRHKLAEILGVKIGAK